MADLAGTWTVSVSTPMGKQKGAWVFEQNADGSWGGTMEAMGNVNAWNSVSVDGNSFTCEFSMKVMGMEMDGTVEGTLSDDGATIAGKNITKMGAADFDGERA